MLQRRPPAARGQTVLSRFGPWGWLGALVFASVAYRLPPLLDAATVDSDAAIVGLQAQHFLHGEWSLFLYGSGYQTSVDSAVAALFFALLGSTSFALVLSTFTGHLVATVLAFATLRRHVAAEAAFVATLPLVFTTSPLHTYILNPPRQAALTLVFLAIYVLDGAPRRTTARGRLAQHSLGAALAGLASFADPYALLFSPALWLLGGLTAFDDHRWTTERHRIVSRIVATASGALLGFVPFVLLLRNPHSVHGEATLTPAVLGHNLKLLVDPCLPWLLGATAYVPEALLGYVAWQPGIAIQLVQRLGAALFVSGILYGGGAFFGRRTPWPVRRLGLFGFVVAVLTLASFLVSVMVMDLFSSRYLAALVLASPFALLPAAARLRPRRLALLLSPFLVSTSVSGWLGYGDEVRGARIVHLPGEGAADERALEALLLARGIHTAIADYWVSYRLTFLYEEAIVVVPIHAREDRYAPYRKAYAEAQRSAYVFDPKRSREPLAAMEAEAFTGEAPWGRPVERLQAGALTAIVFER